MISERMLKKWRREALKRIAEINPGSDETITKQLWAILTINKQRILSMTQELLDQKLLEQKEKK